jgi:hypothetical protein
MAKKLVKTAEKKKLLKAAKKKKLKKPIVKVDPLKKA